MRHNPNPPRSVFQALHSPPRQPRQPLANPLRLLGIRVSLLRQLKWLVQLRRRNNGHGHVSQLRRQARGRRIETHIVVGILVRRLLVKHRALLAVTQYERLIVTLIRPPAAAGIRNRLDNRAPTRRRVQHTLQRLSQQISRPLPSLFLIPRARFVLRLSLSRSKLRHQEKLLHAALRRPNYAIRTTLLASPSRTAAVRKFRSGQLLASRAIQISLPSSPGRSGRKIHSLPLQPPCLVREPEQMSAVRRQVSRRSRLRDRLVRSCGVDLSLHTQIDRNRTAPVPKPYLVRRRDIFLGKRKRYRRRIQNLPYTVHRNVPRRLHCLGRNLDRLLRHECSGIIIDHLFRRAQHPQPLPLPQQRRRQQQQTAHDLQYFPHEVLETYAEAHRVSTNGSSMKLA